MASRSDDGTGNQGSRPAERWTGLERKHFEFIAKALVETCVRNTKLEDLHAGRFPGSEAGDFSDVRVVTPYGEIAWTHLSRISDREMKALMIEVVDRVFTFLQYPEELATLGSAAGWNRPQLDPALMRTVRRTIDSFLTEPDDDAESGHPTRNE